MKRERRYINTSPLIGVPNLKLRMGFNRGYGGTFDTLGYTSHITYKSRITLGCYSRIVKVLYQLDWNDCIVECNHGDVL